MITKVCGMREAQNIREVEALGIDLMGFIFYPPSSRFVTEVPEYLPARAKRVGVFVDADLSFISQRVAEFGLDFVQLHGRETPEFCQQVKAAHPGLGLIKVFSIQSAESLEGTRQYEDVADYFLFDTFCKEKGGSGRTFDHEILGQYAGRTPFLLSGGLSPDNAAEIMRLRHPQLAGYDLNSKFEDAPALKNTLKIKQFLDNITD